MIVLLCETNIKCASYCSFGVLLFGVLSLPVCYEMLPCHSCFQSKGSRTPRIVQNVAMPRQSCSADRMRAVAAGAADEYLRGAHGGQATMLHGLVCEYAGVVREDGSCDADGPLRHKAKVSFCWKLPGDAPERPDRNAIMQTRYDHAVARGVAFPPMWQTALRCLGLQADADASAQKFAEARGLCSATCCVLGQPRRAPPAGGERGVGSIVSLPLGSATAEYALCALVRDALWVCTRGLFVDGALDEDDPFGEASLVVKDLFQSTIPLEADAPRKRVRGHLHRGQLEHILNQRPDAWDAAVALATWRAEVTRASLDGRVPDQHTATRQFERDPFAWQSNPCDCVRTTLLWTWHERGQEKRHFQNTRLKNLLSQGVPQPDRDPALDEELWHSLVDVADRETDRGKAPCIYLGLLTAGGAYQADPSKWTAQYYPARLGKTKATVYYQCGSMSAKGVRLIQSLSTSVTYSITNALCHSPPWLILPRRI